MVRPYGDPAIVTGYIRNIGGIPSTKITDCLNRAASDLEMSLNVTVEISDSYVYINTVKELTELKAACLLHGMYGDPMDQKYYCELYTSGIEELKKANESLTPSTNVTTVKEIKRVTFPSNPDGERITPRFKLSSSSNLEDIPVI